MRFMLFNVSPRAFGACRRTLLMVTTAAIAATSFVGTAQAQTYRGPLTITDTNCPSTGCSFTDNYESTNPNVAAITISTTRPVTITGCRIRGGGTLINAPYVYRDPNLPHRGVNVTVLNTRGYGLNPNVNGKQKGRFLDAIGFENITVEHCYLESTAGIHLGGPYLGDKTSNNTVHIRYNVVRNIDGRLSNGNGGWQDTVDVPNRDFVQFVQIINTRNLTDGDIAWNEVINYPDQSRVEDNINIFASGGVPTSQFLIQHNYIQGAYAFHPEVVANETASPYSGGGILLGDYNANPNPTATPLPQSSWMRASYNRVVNTANYGIGIAAGHDNIFDHNHIISTGNLPNGTPLPGKAGDIGAMIYNHKDQDHIGQDRNFYNNTATDNYIGYLAQNRWFRDAVPVPAEARPLPTPTRPGENVMLPKSSITPALEQQEWTDWRNEIANANPPIGIGPTPEPNLIVNRSFENDGANTQTPSNWNESGTATASKVETDLGYHGHFGSQDGNYHGTHWSASPYEVTTYSYPVGLTQGLYTASVWVRSGGGQTTCRFVISDRGNDQAGNPLPDIYRDIPFTGDTKGWQQIVITDIQVTTTHCKVALYSNSPGDKWMYFDNVELRKQWSQ